MRSTILTPNVDTYSGRWIIWLALLATTVKVSQDTMAIYSKFVLFIISWCKKREKAHLNGFFVILKFWIEADKNPTAYNREEAQKDGGPIEAYNECIIQAHGIQRFVFELNKLLDDQTRTLWCVNSAESERRWLFTHNGQAFPVDTNLVDIMIPVSHHLCGFSYFL